MIQELYLKNFKGFEELRLEFGSLTLLAGLNGMGKSSVLQALLLLRQSHQQGRFDIFQSSNLHDLRFIALALNGDLVSLGIAQDILFEGAQEDQIAFALKWSPILHQAMWDFSYDREANVLQATSALRTGDPFAESLFGDSFHYLQAERIGPRPFFSMDDYNVRHHRQLGARGEYAAHFLSLFGRTDIPNTPLLHPTARSNSLRDQVEAWISEVSPGIRLEITPHEAMDLVNLQYSFATEKQVSRPYRSTNVGFGITYTLPVLVAILSAPPGALLLLENPEAHLHPRGQSRIGDLLARAAACGVQVVVETHSDHVLNGIRVAVHDGRISPGDVRLYYFDRHERDGQARNEALLLKIDENGRIDNWPAGFFDEWDRSLEALLTPREQ